MTSALARSSSIPSGRPTGVTVALRNPEYRQAVPRAAAAGSGKVNTGTIRSEPTIWDGALLAADPGDDHGFVSRGNRRPGNTAHHLVRVRDRGIGEHRQHGVDLRAPTTDNPTSSSAPASPSPFGWS